MVPNHWGLKPCSHSTEAGPEAASEALAQLESDGALALTAGERALRLLCRATLALTAGDPAAASPLLEQVCWWGRA